MSAGPMRITDDELLREVEALKSHRRLSVNRPVLDPDLPDLAASYGGGQDLLSVPSPERERRGYSLVDDGTVSIRSPTSPASSSPIQGYANERARFTARRRGPGAEQSTDSEPGSASSTRAAYGSSSQTTDAYDSSPMASSPTGMGPTSPSSPKDPSHLFWVPASVHPEISPSDFRNFIKEHAARAVHQHADVDDPASADTLSGLPVGESPIAQRLNSVRQQQQQRQNQPNDAKRTLIGRATSLSRRGSTLRRQYRPENDTDDTDEDKAPRPLQRNRSVLSRGGYGLAIPNLTIDDLQKLEAAAEQASQTQDPAMLRSVLRRTLSLNTGPDLDTVDAVPAEPLQDPDAPIIVPKPGQILRRAARTKMRKASGDSTRGSLASRRRVGRDSIDAEGGAPSEGSRAWELQRSDAEDMERRHSGQSELSSGPDDDSQSGESSSRPVSAEAADSIVDAYSRDSYHSDGSQRTSVTSVVESTSSETHTQSGSIEQPDSETTSPPLTPTQDSYATLPSILDGTKRREEAVQLADPQETPRAGSKIASDTQIRPVPVSHLPPVPAFEKSRPQQQQYQQPRKPDSRPSSAGSQSSYDPVPGAPPSPQSQPQALRRDAPQKPQIAPIVTNQQQQQQRPPAPIRPKSPPPATTSHKHKEKERRGAFGLSWFGLGKDDEDDRAKAEKESQRKREKHEKRERKEREREEKDREESSSSSFLGALFGKKKGHDEHSHQTAQRPSNGQPPAGILMERNEMGVKPGSYYWSRYPIHIERAVYRLSHIKLANPRRPLFEQVLISNLMFWYLSVINRSQQGGQPGTQSQQQQQQQQGGNSQQAHEANGNNATSQPAANGAADGYGMVASGHHSSHSVDNSSAYDGMEASSSSPDSEDNSDQWSQSSGGGGGGNGMALKKKRNGLVKPNRAPNSAHTGRTAETPMKQPGYGMQHRQIDDDLKTMGSHSGQLGGSAGFVVGQVVDVKALQANTPYRFVPDTRSGEGQNYPDSVKSATTDYLGLGNQFGSSEWAVERGADGEDDRRPPSQGSAGERKPYRSEAEKERAWLGMRNSGRASPTGGYGNIGHEGIEAYPGRSSPENSHPQGRSMSVGGIGAMNRTGDWSAANRSRKTSMGHISPSASSQGLSASSSGSSFGTIDEAGGKGYTFPTSSSTSALDYQANVPAYEQRVANGQGIQLPITPGSSAMLDAARSSQSRRR